MPILFLWFILLTQLHVEWSVNPEYAHGWAVPFLCGYMIWRRATHGTYNRQQKAEIGIRPISAFCSSFSPRSIYLLMTLGALLFAATRLVQEANPDWRLINWALALDVIGLTLLWLHLKNVTPTSRHCGPARFRSFLSNLRPHHTAFPLCFFLTAVPWPTLIEAPLIRTLTRFHVGVTVECLWWFGTPAIVQGNAIEISSGIVAWDDACSGIRSLQASLMIALFLGELYRLTILRRAVLCVSGGIVAFLCNLIRTGALVWIAKAHGPTTLHQWHDPAGIIVLMGCAAGIWMVARWLHGGPVANRNLRLDQRTK